MRRGSGDGRSSFWTTHRKSAKRFSSQAEAAVILQTLTFSRLTTAPLTFISADTFIVFKNRLLGKPHTDKEAEKMLNMLNGKAHSVITDFTIMDTASKKILSRSVETKVYFKKLGRKEINAYVRSKEPLDKAGAYAIQGLGSVFIERIDGDFLNVVGLPLLALAESLKKFGITVA
ncbi:MAG: septum formation protein Maf [Nitrospirae bacterium]|nr:septum formation protein Maf [Nitrospirota bacterium]